MAENTASGRVCTDFSDLRLTDVLWAVRPGGAEAVASGLRTMYPRSADIALASLGREALGMGLKACGLPAGAKVALPSVICPTVIQTLLVHGYAPVILDVGPDLQLSPEAVAAMPDDVAAVVAAHIYAIAADMDALDAQAKERGILLVDDAAQAFGVRGPDGAFLGARGDFGILSFGPYKNLASSRGGALLMHRQDVNVQPAQRREPSKTAWRRLAGVYLKTAFGPHLYRALRGAGDEPGPSADSGAAGETAVETGPPYAITSTEAAALRVLLNRFESVLARRAARMREVGERILAMDKRWGVRPLGGIDRPCRRLPLVFENAAGKDVFVEALTRAGVAVERVYTPLHRLPRYAAYAGQDGYLADDLCQRVTVLPVPLARAKADALARALDAL